MKKPGYNESLSYVLFALIMQLPIVTSFIAFHSRSQHVTPLKASSDGTSQSCFLATCIPGLAQSLASELQEIHPEIRDVEVSGNAAVTFSASREASLYALCWTRTAHRLLELIASEEREALYNRDDLHLFINQNIDVKELLGDGKGGLLTLAVKAVLNNPRQLPQDLSHSHYTALTIKNALCDVVREMRGDRPDVDLEDPDVPLVAILLGNNGGAFVSLYKSLHPPGSLHKRGYRQNAAIHKASMKESLAAGLLREAGWHHKLRTARKDPNQKLRLVDPMCGSGSLVLEAAMMATDIAPGLMRIRCQVPGSSLPPVTRWKDDKDNKRQWKQVLLDASKRANHGLAWIRDDPSRLVLQANDIHPGAIEIMEASAETAGFSNLIDITNDDCYDLIVEGDNEVPCFVTTNPPWGVRLTEDIEDSWEGLRHFLRDTCPQNTEAWILSGHKGATALLKLRRDKMVPIQTGDQHLRWIQYTIGGARAETEKSRKTQQAGGGKSSFQAQQLEEVEDSW